MTDTDKTPGDRRPLVFDLLGKGAADIHVADLVPTPTAGSPDKWDVRIDLTTPIRSETEALALSRSFPAADVYYRRAQRGEWYQLVRKADDTLILNVYGEELGAKLVQQVYRASDRKPEIVARFDVGSITLEKLTALQSKHRSGAAAEASWEHDQLDLFEGLTLRFVPGDEGEELPAEKAAE